MHLFIQVTHGRIMFLHQKDLIQDYCTLNDIMVKNRYPLPLISELIKCLKGVHWFTKLDVRWGYRNMWIKEGNEWKAAFALIGGSSNC
jgi:hypothetical protein